MNRDDNNDGIGRQASPAGAWRCGLVALALMLACGLAGCQAGQPGGFAPADRVNYLLLQVAPAAANWSGRPEPEGVELSAMLFQTEGGTPMLGDGTMEFAIYEGILTSQQLAQAKPYYQWRFTTAQLAQAQWRMQVGWGYAFRLAWGDHVPRTASITLTGRFVPKAGPAVSANPVIIAMGLS